MILRDYQSRLRQKLWMPSTRWIQGRLVPAEEILWLREGMGLHPEWSRERLARELCLPWQWHEGRGRLKDFAARSFLLKLEAQALLTLPPLRESKRRPRRGVAPLPSWQEPPVWGAVLEPLQPLRIALVKVGSADQRAGAIGN